jgi:hypothetical protein
VSDPFSRRLDRLAAKIDRQDREREADQESDDALQKLIDDRLRGLIEQCVERNDGGPLARLCAERPDSFSPGRLIDFAPEHAEFIRNLGIIQ